MLRPYRNELTLFPTPDRHRDVCYSRYYRDSCPISVRSSRRETVAENRKERDPRYLRKRDVPDRAGDLGWTLDYATAWAYRNLVGNQTEVVDALDGVREIEEVDGETPYVIFDHLDRVMFAGKLRGMVCLLWKGFASSSPGITSAPLAVNNVSRICIELNRTPFEDGDGDIDQLLDYLIHSMIHAFFLITCGAQKKGEKQDGRLLDGEHFGMILYTIRDISRKCVDGQVPLTFHAADRREQWTGPSMSRVMPNDDQRFISLDPRGQAAAPPPADGQSHCMLDNRRIRRPDIKNWQVHKFSAAIDLGLEGRGESIWDWDSKTNDLVERDRKHVCSSQTYIELTWDEKRVMVQRKHVAKYKSIKKPLEKNGMYELSVPECSKDVFSLLYDFINKGTYHTGALIAADATTAYRTGPPVLTGINQTSKGGVAEQLEVFKVAESMKFEELQKYVLDVLWQMPSTNDDGIVILKYLYKDTKGPVHADLHTWARHFLVRQDSGTHEASAPYGVAAPFGNAYHGFANIVKLMHWRYDELSDLYQNNAAFHDDYNLAMAQLIAQSTGTWQLENPARARVLPPAENRPTVARITEREVAREREMVLSRAPLRHSRRLYDPACLLSPASSMSALSLDDARFPRQPRPLALDWQTRPLALPAANTFANFGVDGRGMVRDPLTGGLFVGGRGLWD